MGSRDSLLLAARVLIGGLMVYSGCAKLSDPQFFGFALRAFRLGFDESVIVYAAYALPWTEVVAGALTLVGLWTRAASTILVVLFLAFVAGISSLLVRDLHVACPCFGKLKLVCDGAMGWCHITRNLVCVAISLPLVLMGGGRVSVDDRLSKATTVAQEAASPLDHVAP